jgi:nitrate/nitrite transporter NarK
MGILADRFGARKVFSILMAAVSIPVFLVPQAGSYQALLVTAFFLGLAGSSFSVGVSYVSRWSPPAKQGGVLGVYGMGNIGQSAAVFLGPLLAAAIGWETSVHGSRGRALHLGGRSSGCSPATRRRRARPRGSGTWWRC